MRKQYCSRDKQEINARACMSFNKLQEEQKLGAAECRKSKSKSSRSFGKDEDDLIFKLHALLGNRWSLIAGRLPGRTASEVKNHWNSHLRRKLLSMGMDPNNQQVRWLNHCSCCANKSFFSDSTRCSLEDDATSLQDLNVGPSNHEEINHVGMEDAAPA